MPDLRERLLEAGFDCYEGAHAGGAIANNKLSLGFDELERYPELRDEIVGKLGERMAVHKPDLIIPIPNGANGYGIEVARNLGIDCMTLGKNPITKDIYFKIGSLAALANYERIGIIEDIPNGLHTSHKVLGMADIAERSVAEIGIWDRGDPKARQPLPEHIILDAIVKEHIQAWLDPVPRNLEFWQYAS